MDLRLLELPANVPSVAYGAVGFLAAVVILARRSRSPNLDAIPTVGSSTWLGSWWGALKYLTNAQGIIQEGYDKYKSAPFKVAELQHWTVILSSRQCLEELTRASADEFSFLEAIDDQIQIRYILGREIMDDPYHVAVIRSRLTRNIPVLYPEMRDEIVTSFDELLDLQGNDWHCVPALSIIEKIVCRTTNRVFVGLPLCRDPDWIDLNIRYTIDAIKGGAIAGLFPKSMRVLATHFLTNVPRNIARGVRHLGPIIEERSRYLREYEGEWDDQPNDLLSWLMDQAVGLESTVERLTNRMLLVNFAAIHSSSNFFTQALFRLAANPQYIQPLREEVEGVIKEDGWSKAAMGKMRKVDSFLRECHRLEGLNIVTLLRKALKDFTFSDGTFIPKGTSVGAATQCLHYDRNAYENPEEFQPFRFAGMPHEEDGVGVKHQFASTTTDYLPFGHGRHACPGRFFAADELKTMLAHTVVTYDVKLEDNAGCPKGWRIGTLVAADPHAKVMLRNRVDRIDFSQGSSE